MNSVIFLTDKEFSPMPGKKGPVLCLAPRGTLHQGVAMVLFYGNSCPHCPGAKSQFEQLPSLVPSCKFALLNLSTYPDVIQKSQGTLLEIESVPLYILFVNGRPWIRYTSQARDARSIATFVGQVLSRIQSTQKTFAPSGRIGPSASEEEMEIIEYTKNGLPIPANLVCEEGGVCYLKSRELYGNSGKK